ncbi:MAG: hypothetical protein RBS40_01885 [Rhodocyclaceae bacterium]|jgi:hypothetical protein|nr:hypothetical protein [Rhodocyclaceae bacterium]
MMIRPRDVPVPARVPLLVAGFAALITGVLAGLWRLGWPVPPFAAGAPHGVLVLCGFFGTLIGLERAVAIGAWWAYAGPLSSATAGLLALAGGSEQLAGALFVAGGMIMVMASLRGQKIQPALHTRVLTLGAACWPAGTLAWMAGTPLAQAASAWVAFLVVTIAGERLELSRVLPPSPAMTRLFRILLAVLISAMAAALAGWPAGVAVLGISLALLALWLARQDVARRTVKGQGLTRYIALCLLAGYAWLGLGGVLYAFAGQAPGSVGFDAALHALLVGFVFSMVFGHAPIILPAVIRLKLPFHWGFYLPLVLLHASLALRLAGDALGDFTLRSTGALGNGLAIGLFLLTVVGTAAGHALFRRSRH